MAHLHSVTFSKPIKVQVHGQPEHETINQVKGWEAEVEITLSIKYLINVNNKRALNHPSNEGVCFRLKALRRRDLENLALKNCLDFWVCVGRPSSVFIFFS